MFITLRFNYIMALHNFTESEYLDYILGPRYLPLDVTLPLTSIYVFIFVCGVIGNFITCIVIIINPSMQNATNLYLFSLAVSDLTLLILGLPNELSVFWQQYPWILGQGLCKIRAYISEMSSYVSVLTIMMFSIERYLAVCKPLHFNAMAGLHRPVYFIIATWIISLICALPFAVYTTISYVEYPPDSGNYSVDSALCAMLLDQMPNLPLYELSSLVFFFVPMLVIIILYVKIGIKIRSRFNLTRRINLGICHKEIQHIQSRKSVIKMLSAVVLTFFICWAPFHTQRLLYIYGQNEDYYPDMNEWLYIFSGCSYYLSTAVNPLLYNFMSSRYRVAFKQILKFNNSKKN